MPNPTIAHQRLHNQHLAGAPLAKPADVVTWLGAVQSQDYAGAKWAVAQRTDGLTDADLEQAFADGRILRTHVLRPTWHFVTPADIRWLLTATAPRIHALNAYRLRQLELDDALLFRSNTAITKALEGGQQLTRAELGAVLAQAGIAAAGQRLGYIVHHAELEALVCSGARRGKQFTYALLDERAPHARRLAPDEALAELTLRYFTGHGPATLKDLVWWSSISMADAKAGLAMVGAHLASETVGDQTLWFAPAAASPVLPSVAAANSAATKTTTPIAYLLPNYDEYISYADRSAVFDAQYAAKFDAKQNIVFAHMIVIDGEILGTWQRSVSKGTVSIQTNFFRALTPAEDAAIAAAAGRYGEFLGLPVVLM